VLTFFPPSGHRLPTGKLSAKRSEIATVVIVPSDSYRARPTFSTGNTRPTSSTTAANSSSGEVPCAASVATRRNAACSLASRPRPARLSAFAIAVANSSVNAAILDSVSAGSGRSCLVEAFITPHRRWSTTIGAPTDERMPSSRLSAAVGPDACA
jgi:hypothetical protein